MNYLIILYTTLFVVLCSCGDRAGVVNDYPQPEKTITIVETAQDPFVGFITSVNPRIEFADIGKIVKSVNKNYKRSGLTKMEFYLIIAQESHFKKDAVGRINKNDIGLMQINKYTYRWFREDVKKDLPPWDVKKLKGIAFNVFVASIILEKYHKILKRRFPDKSPESVKALLINAYNRGVGGSVSEWRTTGSMGYHMLVMSRKDLIESIII